MVVSSLDIAGSRSCSVASIGSGLELVLGHRHHGHGLGPASVEGEVGDGLDELLLGDAVLLGEGEVKVQLLDVAAGDEGGAGDEAPVAFGKAGRSQTSSIPPRRWRQASTAGR